MKNETRNENITFFLKSDTFIVSIKSVDIALYECFSIIFGTISTVFALYMPWYKIKTYIIDKWHQILIFVNTK